MDEPFSALDPLIRMKLQDKLLELQEKLERTIIFVSHDLDEAFKLDNRIVIMEGGRIEQCDTPNGIANNPVSDYVEEFVVHRNPNTFLRAKDTMTSAKIGDGLHVDENTPVMEFAAELTATHASGIVTSDSLPKRLVT